LGLRLDAFLKVIYLPALRWYVFMSLVGARALAGLEPPKGLFFLHANHISDKQPLRTVVRQAKVLVFWLSLGLTVIRDNSNF
jgi:hypothetical protein